MQHLVKEIFPSGRITDYSMVDQEIHNLMNKDCSQVNWPYHFPPYLFPWEKNQTLCINDLGVCSMFPCVIVNDTIYDSPFIAQYYV